MTSQPRRVDGAKVRKLRQASGVPLLRFSRDHGVGKRSMEYIELHGHQPRPETLARIARGLGVPVDDLYEPIAVPA